jgi:hypothetical protein
MEYGKQMREARDNSLAGLYQNPGYHTERVKKHTITIHISSLASAQSSNYPLIEPLRIDELSDVYLDSFISNQADATADGEEIFVLGIKEFNIQSVSNSQVYNNKLIIPNTTGASAVITVAHRATKFNYIGSLNPTTLSSLEISLTKADGITALAGGGDIWITFMIVARD